MLEGFWGPSGSNVIWIGHMEGPSAGHVDQRDAMSEGEKEHMGDDR